MGRFARLFRASAHSRITMIHSVDEFVAGVQYDVPFEVSDRFIARGYAEGTYSREFANHELNALRGNPQVVSFSG